MSSARLVFFALLIFSPTALAESPCQDCWNDTCKEFKGLIPRCSGGGGTKPNPVKSRDDTPAAPAGGVCTTVPECNGRCSSGDMGACVALGSMFENGIGAPVDKAKAEYWYEFACQSGFKQGCVRFKPYLDERNRAANEQRQSELEDKERLRKAEAERKKAEALQREKEKQDALERKKQEAEEKKREELAEKERLKEAEEKRKRELAEAKVREAREKSKKLDWVAVGPLLVAKTETTALQYSACLEAKQCKPAGGAGRCQLTRPLDDLQPQTCVEWAQAAKFCEWAGGRLPSSAEWVAIATNGNKTSYPWGNEEPSAKRAVFKAASASPVGSLPGGASERGILDLSGNVWEWVGDADGAGRREVRGGSWDFPVDSLRPTQKFGYGATLRVDNLGFRCVRSDAGPVSVSVEPVGATLLIDGIPVGSVPWSGALGPGAHKATAKLAQYLTLDQVFLVKAGVETPVLLSLKKDPRGVPGRLEVSSTPPAARVLLDGIDVGATPWSGEVAQGKHGLDVVLEGFEKLTRQVEITLRGPEILKLELTRKAVPTLVPFVTEPPGAAVTEGKVAHGVTPISPTLDPGKHELLFTLEGYAPAKVTVTVPLAEPLKPLKLEALPVDLAVRSTPPGAAVSVDGKPVGKAPWRGKVLPGPHEVTLELPGFVSAKEAATAPGIVNATLLPVPIGFKLVLEPSPPGVVVKVDGKLATPVNEVFLAPVGTRQLEISAPGYKLQRASVVVSKKDVAVLPLKLVPGLDLPPRGLVVTSTPSGAEVSVGDRKLGLTPFIDAAFPDGEHQVTVTLAGYEPMTAKVEVKKGLPAEHAVKLTPASVAVAIESRPDGAQIFLDGEARGVTPMMIRILPGAHRVYLTREGHETVNETRELPVGGAPTWSWSLTPLKGATPVDAGVPAAPGSAAQALLTLLADGAVDADTKRTRLSAHATSTSDDLSRFVEATVPAELRDELCLTHAAKVRTVRYSAKAVDGFGDAVDGQLLVNGKAHGPLPFDGVLPWCVRALQAKDTAGAVVSRPPEKTFEPLALNSDTFEFSSRKLRLSFTAFFEANITPSLIDGPHVFALDESRADLQRFNHAFGIRFDVWGKLLHFSLAAKASPLFRNSLFAQGEAVPYMPLADLFIGLNFSAGSDQVRYRFAVDVGVANLLTPGVRLVNALSIGERFFITLTIDGQYVPDFLVPGLAIGTPFSTLWLLGGTFGLGVGF